MELSATYGRLSAKPRDLIRPAIEKLWTMSGSIARVSSDGPAGNTLLSFKRTLPWDIKPMLVLDASARVRATYKQQEETSRDIVRLRHAPKRYDRVNVYYRQAGSGKETFGKKYQERLAEVAEVINQHPGRKALVLHHMPDKAAGIGDTAQDLPSYLLPGADVAFCHWGVHNATNDYADRDLVITASILHHPRSAIEARGRTASNTRPELDYTDDQVNEIRLGEIQHDLLQGLSRGALRQCDGDQARPCDVYILAGRNSGVKGLLPALFPGANFRLGWGPEAPAEELSAKQKEILGFLEGIEGRVPFPEVYKALVVKQQSFSRMISKPAFEDELTKRGFWVLDGRPKAFIRTTEIVAAFAAADGDF
jgi:hypothetical protein